MIARGHLITNTGRDRLDWPSEIHPVDRARVTENAARRGGVGRGRAIALWNPSRSDGYCADPESNGSGSVPCLMAFTTLRARLCVARRFPPKKRTLPSTTRSRTTCPSLVHSWLRTFNFVAPVTVVTARLVSLPGAYDSTVVFRMRRFETPLALLSPPRSTALNCFALDSSVTRFS